MSIKTFEQEKWQDQHEITIEPNAVVTINGIPTGNPREIALGNIILRLNAGRALLYDENVVLKEQVTLLKAKSTGKP